MGVCCLGDDAGFWEAKRDHPRGIRERPPCLSHFRTGRDRGALDWGQTTGRRGDARLIHPHVVPSQGRHTDHSERVDATPLTLLYHRMSAWQTTRWHSSTIECLTSEPLDDTPLPWNVCLVNHSMTLLSHSSTIECLPGEPLDDTPLP